MYESPFFFCYFPRRNVISWRENALHSNVRLTPELYGNYSDFLCFGENLSQYLMEKNVKFVLNDVKATAFSVQKGAT